MQSAYASIEVVGTGGQVSIGEQFAGQEVVVEQKEPGVWVVRTMPFVSESERWLHHPQTLMDLQTAIEWARNHPPQETDLDALAEKLNEAD